MIRLDENIAPTDRIHREKIDIYDVFHIKNIASYSHVDFLAWEVNTHDVNIGTQHIYFAADTVTSDAFAHWVFECAIYLPLFKLLQVRHPSIKLYLRDAKTFKSLFCTYFGITSGEIVYDFDTSSPSVCYFPSPISALNDKRLHPAYVEQLDLFWNKFKDAGNECIYSVTVMPRQIKENYAGNNRSAPLTKVKEFAESIPYSTILNTDSITDLDEQIDILRKSRVTVLTDGSPLLVNGMFSYDKRLIVSGNYICTPGQAGIFGKMKYIIDKIKSQNKSFNYIPDESMACVKIYEYLSSA